jgi:asparagine synthase (glutamine-hydrolysing)
MCGITGILNFNQQPVCRSTLKVMTDVIAHRGPDGEGQYVDGFLGFGHRRLAIIDLSSAAHQPMQTHDKRYAITYNGEVYNFKELRGELESLGYQFYSQSDTEVILNAFVEWKERCLTKFNGMFAFAIWDKKEKKLFIARDRYGVKPLYFLHTNNSFIFGSEVKAILKSGKYTPSLDKEALVEYLTFQNFFTDKTLFQDIKMLMPGYCAFISASGQFNEQQYWDFNFCGSMKLSEDEAVEETSRLFEQAVQRQLIGDVPINSYLSGGIDSGAIAMTASQFSPNMKTFTVGFDLMSASGLELSFDEREKAEHISYLAKTEHYEMVLKAGDMERCMQNYVSHLEEPRVGQSYPNYYAAKLASKFGKVVLSGCGGDELFGGYPWRYFHTKTPVKFDNFIDAYYLKWQRLISNSTLKNLLQPIWRDVEHIWTRDIFANIFKSIRKPSLSPDESINYSLYLESKTFLNGLLIVEDKLSMAHSLETRLPFLDNDLVDFAQRLPPGMKIHKKHLPPDANENDFKSKKHGNLVGKKVLRKSLSKLLPEKIINYKKQGFSSPDASWFKGDSIEYVRTVLNKSNDFLDQKTTLSILEEHASGSINRRLAIWSLLYLIQFENIFMH